MSDELNENAVDATEQYITEQALFQDRVLNEWSAVINDPNEEEIKGSHRKACTAVWMNNLREDLLYEDNLNRERQGYAPITMSEAIALNENGGNAPHGTATGNVQNWNPIMFSMLRRATPNLMAFDVCGVQPMTGPTGLIFAIKSLYRDSTVTGRGTRKADGSYKDGIREAQFQEVEHSYSGSNYGGVVQGTNSNGAIAEEYTIGDYNRRLGTNFADFDAAKAADSTLQGLAFATSSDDARSTFEARLKVVREAFGESSGISGITSGTQPSSKTGQLSKAELDALGRKFEIFGTAFETADGEELGSDGNAPIPEMTLEITKSTVEAKTRALQAKYTVEMSQDMRKIHGLDIETELKNMLATEVIAETNREVIRTINSQAKLGFRGEDILNQGVFDLDTDGDGRWGKEKYMGLVTQLEFEANRIAKETRRGRGNIAICGSNVATILRMSGMLDYSPKLSTMLMSDDTGKTFVGVLNGFLRVYIDPYAEANYITVGYKGDNAFDAGVFYAPYIPLSLMRAVGENTYQPKIAFKTRYGIVSNPFVDPINSKNRIGLATAGTNQFYSIGLVKGTGGDITR